MKNIDKQLARMLVSAGALVGGAAHAVSDLPGGPAVRQWNLHPPVTRIAEEQQWLHNFMMILCTLIFIAVFAVMFYSIWKHRKSVGHKAANFHESITVELVWTIVPFIIVILMALPATKVLVAQKDTTNSDLTIKATGYQWKWGYDYVRGEGEGIRFVSTLDAGHRQMSNDGAKGDVPNDYLLKVDNPLVVPVGKKVRIITTANDVIHAFMVPAFGIKQDAIPGFVRDTWFRAEKTGDFYGQCAELCGKEHAYMPIHVKVLSAEAYTAWVGGEMKKIAAKLDDPSKVWTLDDLVARGEKVYAANCAACHQANGKGAGPIKALDGSPVVLGPKAEQMHVLLEGRANGAMPAWTQLSDTDLAAVTTYTKNHWSNKTGELVQPSEFKAAREGKFPEGGGKSAQAAPEAAITLITAGPAATAPAATAAPAPAAAAPQPADAKSALSTRVLFAVGQFTLGADAKPAIDQAAQYLKQNPDSRVVLSGFVDSSGNAADNAELARNRAFAVRDAIKRAAGVDDGRIELRKPEDVTARSASERDARRVDIKAAG